MKVLVVDDSEAIRDLLGIFLKKRGFDVIAAPDGNSAVELVRQQRPQVALIDMRLPDIDGLEVLRRIKQLDPAVRVILLSGLSSPEIEEEARLGGAAGTLSKSSGLEEIVNAIGRDSC